MRSFEAKCGVRKAIIFISLPPLTVQRHNHEQADLEVRILEISGNSIGFLDRLTDRLKMGDGLKMSDFGLGMS